MLWRIAVPRISCSSLRMTYSSLGHQDDNVMNVFDRKAKRLQRNRAALREDIAVYDYLKDEIASRLADRIGDISRFFPLALDLGCGRGHIAKQLTKEQVGKIILFDSSEKLLEQCEIKAIPSTKVHGDEEFLAFKESTFDIIISSLSLHWVNNLPGTFEQVLFSLKADGAFIGAMFAGNTLYQLRSALQLAEMEREGGFGAHISPFTQMKDIGSLLTRAGFNLTTVDADDITVGYPNMFELMHDLKGMGENNASRNRKHILHRDTMKAAAAIYQDMYGLEDGSIPATFEILFFIGWKPDKSQQKPLKPGSATYNLKDLDSLDSLNDDTDKETK